MHSRAISYAAREHLQDLDYAISHLEPDPVGAQFAPDAEAARAALETKMDDWTATDRALATAQAGLLIAEENLSNAARKARAGILDDVHYKRDARKIVTYLPHGLHAVTTVSFLEEVGAVRVLAAHCAQDPSPTVQALSGPLVTAADEAQAAYDRRRDALVAEGAAYGRLQVEKINATDALRQIAHRLLEVLGNDRDKVNSFFRPVARPRRNNAAARTNGAEAEAGTVTPIATESPAKA